MSKYKVTIKVTETYTCEVGKAGCESDAIATAFSERYAWLYDGCDEYHAKAEEVDEGWESLTISAAASRQRSRTQAS